MNIVKEACVDSFQQAIKAERFFADRVEVCDRLDVNGITPERSTIDKIVNEISIPTKIMIRPRQGNFIYSDLEIKLMISDIEYCKKIGINEIVLGLLKEDGEIDIKLTTQLSEIAYPMSVTFHKAIDYSNNILKGIETLCKIDNITSILTSGGKKRALDAKDLIKKIISEFSTEINIIVAGKITNQNLNKIHEEIGATQYHGKRIVGNLS